MPPAISLQGVSKRYRIYPSHRERLKEILSLGRNKRGSDFWALRDVSFAVERGTTLGIMGRNGAGKSTLLQIISGVLEPTGGSVSVEGRLAALLQLGAGFNAEFTGRENVMLNGLILGLDRREMIERFDEIEEFADIGEFMDQPVKTYSSGMRARLGFAVAVNVEPDVLIVDETLSVGDAVFKHMGLQKMRDLRDNGTTILFVSHSTGMVKNFCSEGVLLHKGEMLYHGATSETIDRYQALLSRIEAERRAGASGSAEPLDYDIDGEGEETARSMKAGTNAGAGAEPAFKEDARTRRVSTLRHGTGEARIRSVEVLDGRGRQIEEARPDEKVTVRVHLEYLADVKSSMLKIILRNKNGLDVFATDTGREKAGLGAREKGEKAIVDFTFEVPLQHGAYSVTAAVAHSKNKQVFLDWLDVAAVFKVGRPEGRGAITGLFHIPTEVEVHDLGRNRDDRSA